MSTQAPMLPVALTIAGSDSGGGAGIQADLKTFSALGVFGTSALTAITAQNPDGVSAIQGIDPPVVAEQMRQVLRYFPVGGAKTGMLFSSQIIEAVAGAWRRPPEGVTVPPLVVDPVMVAASGARLLQDEAIGALQEHILPLAAVVTPNMAEAALLAGRPVEGRDDLEPAARAIHDRHGVAVLLKGGHLRGSAEALDLFWDGRTLEPLTAPFLAGHHPHGTGCALSSAIAAHLALGRPLREAIAEAKRYLHRALEASLPAGATRTLNLGFAPRAWQAY